MEGAEDYDFAVCGLLITNSQGTIVRSNRTFQRWSGYDETEVASRRFQDLLTMGSKLFHHTQWMPLLQLQGSIAEVQLELVAKDGDIQPVLVNAARRGDNPTALVDIAVFIANDRRNYERELLAARTRAEHLLAQTKAAQDALHRDAEQRAALAEQLIGIVSHDLRNPLNVVLLGTHLLSSSGLGTETRVIARIATAAERANRLVADLLDFTQARIGGGLPVRARDVDLHAVVAECVEEAKLAWPGRMIVHRRVGAGTGFADPIASRSWSATS